MKLPYLTPNSRRRKTQEVAFYGVNYGENTAAGQLEDSRNLTSERFPCMSQRAGRENVSDYQNATAMFFKNGLLVVDGSDLIYNGEVVGAVSPGKKQFAAINTKVVIMPDKVVFDTKTKELRGLGAEYTTLAGAAVFANSNTESKLTTHIGSYVEGIAGSGNVGGNDVLGEKSPTFMIDKAPFTTIYESGKVNEETGSFDFGAELSGDSLQAQNVAVGSAFKAASLGADGVKRFGRITGKTKFAENGYQDGATCHAWKRYNVVKSEVTTTNLVHGTGYDKAVSTGFSHSLVKAIGHYRAMPHFYTKYSSGTLTLVFGNGVYIGEDGYFQITNGTTVTYTFSGTYSDDLTDISIGSFYKEKTSDPYAVMYVGLMDGGKIKTYIKMYVKTLDEDEPFSPGDLVTIDRIYRFREGTETDENGEVTGYTYGVSVSSFSPSLDVAYTATINTVSSWAAARGAFDDIVYGMTGSDYPANGMTGDYWYVYAGAVTYPCFYGFDYDLIEARDAEGVSGFEAVNFRAGDTVEITGCTSLEQNNITATIREITEETANGVTRHSLVFDSGLFTAGTEESAVTIARKVPNLSVICERANRLYGAEGNTIYVSALGDPTNMYTYDGVDTDSYSVAVATDGVFTGCIGYGNAVLFFKEERLHKLMGDYPSEFTLYDYTVPGVMQGSENSLWNINEVIYYHGREGIYRYAGGAPELISENFGLRRFLNAAAGAEGDRYYISMQDKKDQSWGLWVYDIGRGIWLQEDDTQAADFAFDSGKLYYIDGGAGKLVLVNPDSSTEVISWSGTLCRTDETMHERKYYPRLNIRLDAGENSVFRVEVSQDDGEYQKVYEHTGKTPKTIIIPVLLPRCDNFRIRLSGEGPVLVRSLVREYEVGSQLF